MALLQGTNRGSAATESLAIVPFLIVIVSSLTIYFMQLWSGLILNFYLEKALIETLETKRPHIAKRNLKQAYKGLLPWITIQNATVTLKMDHAMRYQANGTVRYCIRAACYKTQNFKKRTVTEKRIMDSRL